MRSVPLPFLSKITLLWTRAREPGPVSPVKVDSPLPFPWTQRGEIYIHSFGQVSILFHRKHPNIRDNLIASHTAILDNSLQQEVYLTISRRLCL